MLRRGRRIQKHGDIAVGQGEVPYASTVACVRFFVLLRRTRSVWLSERRPDQAWRGVVVRRSRMGWDVQTIRGLNRPKTRSSVRNGPRHCLFRLINFYFYFTFNNINLFPTVTQVLPGKMSVNISCSTYGTTERVQNSATSDSP